MGRKIEQLNTSCLAAYQANPDLVEEHANAETIQTEGGYGRRQVWELIQNGADELIGSKGRVEVVMTEDTLYCANEGNPVSADGASAILTAYRSPKKGPEIGRFGLGFKSVLGVSTCPEFISRSGSFSFSPDHSAELIGDALDKIEKVPTLRLAKSLNPDKAAADDSVLASLMEWATTVVRLPLDKGQADWLHIDIAEFPDAFLVFSPHVSLLVLEDRTQGIRREISLIGKAGDEDIVLQEGDRKDSWRVIRDSFAPSEQGHADGGAMADRERISYQWAVPLKARQRPGQLWAHFPTLEETTLSGVINAPWKLNDDRTRVIDGTFNREIIKHASGSVLANLELLVDSNDPGNVLEILPGRGREARNWADGEVTELINTEAADYPCIPDQNGELAQPKFIKLLDPDAAEHLGEALVAWQESDHRPVDWAHPSVYTNATRRSRASIFTKAALVKPSGIKEWLEALLITSPDLESSIRALEVVATMSGNRDLLEEAASADIIFDSTGSVTNAREVFLPGSDSSTLISVPLIDESLLNYENVMSALTAMEVKPVDPFLEFEAFLKTHNKPESNDKLGTFWDLAAAAAEPKVLEELEERGITPDKLLVRVKSGDWVRLIGTLLPGSVASAEEAPESVIDVEFHAKHLSLLKALGAIEAPVEGKARFDEPALRQIERNAKKLFLQSLGAATPDESLVSITPNRFAGPVTPFESLPDLPRARFTKALIAAQVTFPEIEVRHSGNRYKPLLVENPLITLIRTYGCLELGDEVVAADRWVAPTLRHWHEAGLLAVPDLTDEAARALKLPTSLCDLDQSGWDSAESALLELGDGGTAARFYAEAAASGRPRGSHLLAQVGDEFKKVSADEVRLSFDDREISLMRSAKIPFLPSDGSDSQSLQDEWNLATANTEVSTKVSFVESTDRLPLIDVYPALRVSIKDELKDVELARCSSLAVETHVAGGVTRESRDRCLSEGVVYLHDTLNDQRSLHFINQLLRLNLTDGQQETILENRQSQETRRFIRELKQQESDAERLALIADGQQFRDTIPISLIEAVESVRGPLDGTDLAQVALVTHGVEVLAKLSPALEAKGLQPPSMWAGSPKAVAFVASLGFSPELAGFKGSSGRASALVVEGTPTLQPLHDYQQIVVDEIQTLFTRDGKTRGLVALPTGAGKTRVAIQALAQAMMDGKAKSPILWVAQRDELCEQAVQSWSEVWRAIGPPVPLTISRLWTGNDVVEAEKGHQVVVATIQKLNNGLMDDKSYKWLARSGCLVIDEAHGATTPAYTRLLEWQGIDRNKERAPLIGLTATPYRGTSEAETKRLIARFGGNRLEARAFDGADPYAALQNMGVLSRVDHQLLEGASVQLTEQELAQVTLMRRLPSSVEERIGSDAKRNRILLDSVSNLPEEWTVLMFCASVEHAKVIAALLNEEDIPAAAISGETPAGARRHYVEEFRSSRLRVLTNFAVFAEGFDAPEVRAVYVARPTYSPNLYQQMIGRGLRGPLNGGSEECRIVNVEDNINNFGDALAFKDFENLWNPGD